MKPLQTVRPDPEDPAWAYSNHWTKRLPDGTWAKVSDLAGEHDERIHTEHALNKHMGHQAWLEHHDGRCVLLSSHRGNRPERLGPGMIDSLLRLPAAPDWLRDASDLPDRIRGRVRDRLRPDDPVTSWCLARLESLDVTALRGRHLVHTDPHLSNWVVGDRVGLIDWESAVTSCRELDLAAFAHSALIAGQDDLALSAIGAAQSQEALVAGWVAKTATGMSWYRAMLYRTADPAVAERTRERLALIRRGDRLLGATEVAVDGA